MSSRKDLIAISSVILLVCTGLGYAQGSAVEVPGQDAAEQQRARDPRDDSSSEQNKDDPSGVCQGPIHPEVYTELEGSAEGTAYVIVILKPAGQEVPTPEQTKASV
ncbi:MAG: hypothetical protein ACYSUI_24855, partial [Planctomycetota bacterium]